MAQVKNALSREVRYCDRQTTLKEAADKMKMYDIGALPVVENDKVVGLLTDRDMVVRTISEGHDPNQSRVGDAMTEGVVTIYEDDSIESAAELMKKNQIRRLVVLNREDKLAGVTSLGDLATIGIQPEKKAEVVEEVSKPSTAK